MGSCRKPGWGLCTGLTVPMSSDFSQDVALSPSLPTQICLRSNKTEVRESSVANILDKQSTTVRGQILLIISWAMIYSK